MPKRIDYYFYHLSPWTYLGHKAFMEMADQQNCYVRFRPVNLPSLFEQTGGLPVGKRHASRQHQRILELQRWGESRKLPLNLKPKYFPTDASLADRICIALDRSAQEGQTSQQAEKFSARVLKAVWVDDLDIADEDILAKILTDIIGSREARTFIDEGQTPEMQAIYESNLADAISSNVFGAPSYVLNGEVFWGQDRVELLKHAIQSQRSPYTA